MNDRDKTKEQLIAEVTALRAEVARFRRYADASVDVRAVGGHARGTQRHDPMEVVETITARTTELDHVHATLQHSEARFRRLVEANIIGVITADFRGTIVDANDAFLQLVGYGRDELVNGTVRWNEMTPPEYRHLDEQAIEQLRSAGSCAPFEKEYLRKHGGRVPVLVGVALLDGSQNMCVAFVLDLEKRKQAEEQVRAAHEQLACLSRQLLRAQENERRHLARELHDEVGQALTGLKLILDISSRVPPQRVHEHVQHAHTLVTELMSRVRALSLDLRPGMLDDLGLLPTLLWYGERYTAQTNIQVHVTHTGVGRRFAPDVETAAYRIVQEALTNVARYAGVEHVDVRLHADETTLCVEIEDRGVGFDAPAAIAANASSGLTGMRERAMLLGGQLTINAAVGRGTRVRAEFPVHAGQHSITGDRA